MDRRNDIRSASRHWIGEIALIGLQSDHGSLDPAEQGLGVSGVRIKLTGLDRSEEPPENLRCFAPGLPACRPAYRKLILARHPAIPSFVPSLLTNGRRPAGAAENPCADHMTRRVRPGWGVRHPATTQLVRSGSPIAVKESAWANGKVPLGVSAHLGTDALPDELVLSVRCVVRVDDDVVVCTNIDGGSHAWPDGRASLSGR